MINVRLGLIALSLSSSLVINSCGGRPPKKLDSDRSSAYSSNTVANPLPQPQPQPQPPPASMEGTLESPAPVANPINTPVVKIEYVNAMGLLNFRQINSTFSGITGINLSAPAAAGGSSPLEEYRKALTALPTDSGLAAITSGKVAAATKLAAAYCDVLANNPAKLAEKFPDLKLNGIPPDSMAFAKVLLDGFYGPETSLQGDRATDIKIVADSVDALKGLTKPTGPGIFMATCAGIISSAEFFVY